MPATRSRVRTDCPAVCFGAVGYAYNIGTYEVTNAQYAEFLNAKAASDPLGLYSTSMGAILRSGVSGSFTYTVFFAQEDVPVNWVSFYDAIRFANWMNNGQGSGDTETGAYALLGGTATPSNGSTVTRNPGAAIFLPNEDEWFKAAYHNALGLQATDYFDYPAGSDTQTTCAGPTATANRANCALAVGLLIDVGRYTGSASPYGTFDQGGNVAEWNETLIGGSRGIRGGQYGGAPSALAASSSSGGGPAGAGSSIGFRLAMIPEPGTGLIVVAGLLGMAGWRSARA